LAFFQSAILLIFDVRFLEKPLIVLKKHDNMVDNYS